MLHELGRHLLSFLVIIIGLRSIKADSCILQSTVKLHFNTLPNIYTPFNALFTPLFAVSNGANMPYLGPQHLFLSQEMTTFGAATYPKVARRGCAPFCLGV
jgi:hypothetical protein